MNDDNDANRRMVEQCYRTRKTMVNPIVDWTDEDVWNFLNGNNIEHCCLYDEGYARLGCIGCPLSGSKNMLKDFERYPKYKENYIRAFQRMIDRHPGEIKVLNPEVETKFKIDDIPKEFAGGGMVPMVDEILLKSSSTSSCTTAMDEIFEGGRYSETAVKMYLRWLVVALC